MTTAADFCGGLSADLRFAGFCTDVDHDLVAGFDCSGDDAGAEPNRPEKNCPSPPPDDGDSLGAGATALGFGRSSAATPPFPGMAVVPLCQLDVALPVLGDALSPLLLTRGGEGDRGGVSDDTRGKPPSERLGEPGAGARVTKPVCAAGGGAVWATGSCRGGCGAARCGASATRGKPPSERLDEPGVGARVIKPVVAAGGSRAGAEAAGADGPADAGAPASATPISREISLRAASAAVRSASVRPPFTQMALVRSAMA